MARACLEWGQPPAEDEAAEQRNHRDLDVGPNHPRDRARQCSQNRESQVVLYAVDHGRQSESCGAARLQRGGDLLAHRGATGGVALEQDEEGDAADADAELGKLRNEYETSGAARGGGRGESRLGPSPSQR